MNIPRYIALVIAMTLSAPPLSAGTDLFRETLPSGYGDKFAYEIATNRLNVKDALARLKQGNAELKEGAVDRAIGEYDLALALDGLLVEAYRMRGIAYAKKGETDSAIANFRTVLYFYPEDEDAKERLTALGAKPK